MLVIGMDNVKSVHRQKEQQSVRVRTAIVSVCRVDMIRHAVRLNVSLVHRGKQQHVWMIGMLGKLIAPAVSVKT